MKKLLLLFLMILNLTLFGQGDFQNQSKYWYYRYQIRSKFLKAGEAPYPCVDPDLNNLVTGHSIPAASIGIDHITNWGDATTHLGGYIAVLATEYRLLKDQGLNTSYTEEELYYAMKAFERLDLHGEKNMWPYNGPCTLNGFFGRDDVSTEFGKQYFSNKINSDYIGYNKTNNPHDAPGAVASQDQIIYLTLGFALVVKCVDAGANYNGYYFVARAKLNTYLMINYIASNNYSMPIPFTNILADHSGDIPFNSFGFAKAGQVIKSGNWGGNIFPTGDYENAVSANFSAFWESYPTPLGFQIMSLHDFTRVQTQYLAAIGHSWRIGLVPVKVWEKCFHVWFLGDVCAQWWCYPAPLSSVSIPLICGPFEGPTIAVNVTQHTLDLMGLVFSTEIAPLLHHYLHNTSDLGILPTDLLTMLNTAPCQGPYYYGGGTGIKGWRSSYRFSSPSEANNGNSVSQGDFNGLDYMLLFNLYRLTFPSLLSVASKNELHVDINNNFPIASANKYGSDANPALYKAFESINISGTLAAGNNANTNGNLTLHAPMIALSNFDIKAGSTFDTDVTPFQCNSTGTGYLRVAASDTAVNVIDTAAMIAAYNKKINALLAEEVNKQAPAINKRIEQSRYEPINDYIRRVENLGRKNSAVVYPNPASASCTLDLKIVEDSDIDFTITDLSGKEMIKVLKNAPYSEGSYKINFDVNSLPEGSYLFIVKTNKGAQAGRFVKVNY